MNPLSRLAGLAGALYLLATPAAHGEAMLQYFNTSWAEITRKMPELAEAGYDSLWLPPPTKGSGGLSVGYDCWDRFDLGSKDQRGTVRTRYGTEAELLEMVRVAHRFGIRIYFDNIMNHNAFETPKYNDSVPENVYTGFLPADFHLRKTADGFYRKWDNTRDWNSEWQVQNLGLSDLIDIATEPGSTNRNHGTNEGDTATKPNFVRHPDNPEFYCYVPTAPGQKHSAGQGNYVGFGPGNGITAALIAANSSFYSERVEEFLNRSARWELDRTKADGFRLDAVKHTPADFFGATFGADKDSSNYGYTGQIQQQFNLSRGFSDWGNHRDSVFDTEQGRDDAMLFGEHLGQPPGYGSYIDAGMRLIDNDLRNNLNNVLGNPSSGLQGYDQPGYGGFSAGVSVMHAQSHDNDYASRRELQHALYLTRAGMGLIYTDGNYHADVLGASGGAFPRHANTAFLGQWGDARIPNLLKIHNDFARGWQRGRYSDADLVSYERIDDREFSENDQALKERKGATMLIAVNDNYASGKAILGGTSFPSQGGGGSENNADTNDEYLFQYARGYGSQTGFYTYASSLNSVVVAPGSYFVFAPRTPEESDVWKNAGGSPITIYQGTEKAGTFEVERKDGTDGDPGFNPYGLPDAVTNDYTYRMPVPRVTSASDLRFVVRADGSAQNILLKLDGGIDLNGTRPAGNTDPLYRDLPPALSTDVFMGYEQPTFAHRQFAEKFAAKNSARNQIGSSGAETYQRVIGGTGFTIANGPDNANDFSTQGGEVASFLYHDPAADAAGTPAGGWPGGVPPKQYTENASTITVWAKPNGVGTGFNMYFYYTTDGSNPEGAGGTGTGATQVVEMHYSHNQGTDDWWSSASIPKPAAGVTLKYKLGIYKEGAASVYPSGPDTVAKKKKMMTIFNITGFNAGTVSYAPHNDYGTPETGLAEGFHVLRARPFLKRGGKASLYNTFTQTFYYDAATPTGQIMFPSADGATVGGSEYGSVVRADAFTTEVWYKIDDGDASNDDSATGANSGNGAWVKASEVTPNASITPANPAHAREFRFNYVNIPATGNATIQVRLKELTSSSDSSLGDVAGHFTTLTRTVSTSGPDRKMFVAFPQSDGASIGSTYVLKTYFSKSLADGLNDAQLKARFTVRYGVDDTWPAGVQTLDAAALSINYNATADYHALAFSLPNLYDGRPGFLYRVEIFQNRPDPLVDLTATRRLAALAGSGPRVSILRPLEVDATGRPVEIILPDEPGAPPMDYTVRVETDTTTTAVDLAFVIGSGALTPVDFDPATAGVQPEVQGSSAFWDFTWRIAAPGSYRLIATGTSPQAVKTETRNATVLSRQAVLAGEASQEPVISTISGGYRLNFPTLPDRIYQLQVSTNLVGWSNSGTPLNTADADGPGTFQVDDTSGGPMRFYRVLIQAAP
ncbi:alpha-amylase family glycosyl hydrolase [Haloferula sp. BvORR071]|uniref:alpha-amylase family glycosyl hydrolase n=1 Tax=Haloferula sp. BvORR071 TaxID=1396141 RepID=UPI000557B7E7|nr:alpha-amylase family glycosyl hydrolase [Haloferula sp. BvORR071]